MDQATLKALGEAVRQARGAIDQTEAARLSGLSRSWWLELEKGRRQPRPGKLAQALIAIGVDITPIFELAGYNPAPYLEQQQRWRDAKESGAEIDPPPSEDDEVTNADLAEILTTIAGELQGLRSDLRQRDAAIEQLRDVLATPAAQSPTAPQREAQ